MALKLNYQNTLAETVGSNAGITQNIIEGYQQKTNQIHQKLEELRASGKLGFYSLPHQPETVRKIQDFADSHREDFDQVVVLGIGGSALGMIALRSALLHTHHNMLHYNARGERPRIFVPDNIDPDRMAGLFDLVNLDRTLWIVISKSGSTAETMSQFLIVKDKLQNSMGKREHKKHIVAITDPEKGILRKIVNEEGYTAFDVPSNVGGRFSVLSTVGLVPAALAGIDIASLLAGAGSMADRCISPLLSTNPAYLSAVLHHWHYTKGRKIAVMLSYSHALRDVSDWFRQMWAESLGKRLDINNKEICTGPTPIKAVGATDQHSQLQLYLDGPADKFITFLSVENFNHDIVIPEIEEESLKYLGSHNLGELFKAEERATRLALTKKGRPNCTIIVPKVDAHHLGELFYMLSLQTAFAGGLWEVNPFDQPAVEQGKNYTYGLMGRAGYENYKKEVEETIDLDSNYEI